MNRLSLMSYEVLVHLTKVTEHIIEIVLEEHPEIVARAIIKTMEGKNENESMV